MLRPVATTLMDRRFPEREPSRTDDEEQQDAETRFAVTATAIAIDGIALAFTQAHIEGAGRLWFGLLFVLIVPGWAIVGLLRLRWPAAEVSLVIGVGLAVSLLIAQCMLWAHAWHPIWEQFGVGFAALPLLAVQLWRDPVIRSSMRRPS